MHAPPPRSTTSAAASVELGITGMPQQGEEVGGVGRACAASRESRARVAEAAAYGHCSIDCILLLPPFCLLLRFLPRLLLLFRVFQRLGHEEGEGGASTASPDTPTSTGRPRVGRASPAERATLWSLRCGPGSDGRPGRAPEVESSVPVSVRLQLHLLPDGCGSLLSPWS